MLYKLSICLVLLFLTSACSNEVNEARSLQLKQIAFDSTNPNQVKQISFKFNQNIAYLGSTPSQAQINAVSMPLSLKSLCTWRFVQLDILACELNGPLQAFSTYPISIDASFSALGKNLSLAQSERSSAELLTSFPSLHLGISEHKNYMPIEFKASKYFSQTNESGDSSSQALYQQIFEALQLKTPSGETIALALQTQKRENRSIRWQLSLKDRKPSFESGEYSVILPRGFTPTSTNANAPYRSLSQEQTVLSFNYQQHFLFHGLMCKQQNTGPAQTFVAIQANTNRIVPCAPEQLSFAFSRPLSDASTHNMAYVETSTNKQVPLPWLVGPEYTWHSANVENNIYYYSVELQGNSDYTAALGKIESIDGDALNGALDDSLYGAQKKVEDLHFITAEASHLWRFPWRGHNVIETQGQALPYIYRRNTPDLKQTLSNIKSASDLLHYLNNKALKSTTSTLAPTDENLNKLDKQNLLIRDSLNHQSGLVLVNLEGKSAQDAIPRPYTAMGQIDDSVQFPTQQQSRLFNSAAFNLVVSHGNSLLVEAIDWHAKTLANATVSLVCSEQSETIELGRTNQQGTLFLPFTQWAAVYTPVKDRECWLWAQYGKQSAAIALPYSEISEAQVFIAYAYTAQPIYEPGDTVNIGLIAKRRDYTSNEQALLPMQSLNDYRLKVFKPNSDTIFANIALAEISANGMGSATLTLPNNAAVGDYRMALTKTGNEQSSEGSSLLNAIGHIQVSEFTPPEFEQEIRLPQKEATNWLEYGQRLQAIVEARRLNGGILHNAKVITRYQISKANNVPKSWPEDHVFQTYYDYIQYQNTPEITQQHALNSNGLLSFESEPIESSIPIAKLTFSSEVRADDGETQVAQDTIYYLSRQHYVGTQINPLGTELSLIAVNKNGMPLKNIATKVKFYKRAKTQKEKWLLVDECNTQVLPYTCSIPKTYKQLKIEVISGSQAYKWQRRFYRPTPPKPLQEVSYPKLSLAYVLDKHSSNENTNKQRIDATVGSTISLEITSNIAGTATLAVHSGTIQKVWQQDIKAMTQTIDIVVDPSWFPYASISLTMPVDKTHIEQLAKEIASAADKAKLSRAATGTAPLIGDPVQSNTGSVRHWPNEESSLNRFRLLKSWLEMTVVPAEVKPEVQLSVPHSSIVAGGDLKLALHANTALESQIWLVNDGILALSNTNVEEYNPADYMMWYSRATSIFDNVSLSDNMFTDEPEAMALSMASADTETSARLRAPSSPLAKMNSQSPFSKADFAQSLWLGTVSLSANETKNISVKLPQLIGRWKIIAVNATAQQSSVSSTTVTTTKPVEYYLDAPTTILAQDKATLAISQINNTPNAIEDSLTLWINKQTPDIGQAPKTTNAHIAGQAPETTNAHIAGQALQSWPVRLEKYASEGAYKRFSYELPELSVGKHTILLTSKNDPDFAAYAEIQVLENTLTQQQTWLVEPQSLSTDIHKPEFAIANSIVVTHSPSGDDSPHWQALSQYNKRYWYKGWEQSISRALSYAYNPQSKQYWPQGHATLKELLNEQSRYTLGDGNFRYFPRVSSDNFLSAYTAVAYAWLEDTQLPLNIDIDASIKKLKALLDDQQNSNNSPLVHSMALLALSVNDAISLDEGLQYIQAIGSNTSAVYTQAQVLQVLSLRYLNAAPSLYEQALSNLQENQYIDTNNSLFNNTAYKCFAALAYGKETTSYASLTKEVVAQQQQQGHFGSTFANGVCSYLLHKNEGNNDSQKQQTLAYSLTEHKIQLHNPSMDAYWLSLQYEQNLLDVQAVANGIAIERLTEVLRNEKWLPIQNKNLKIGDLVKTTLRINSPIARQHVAISDGIAGGFEALQPNFSNQRYQNHYARSWFYQNNVEISNGKAYWNLHYLPEGERDFVYYSRVRHSGTYTQAPAQIEAIYRNDVKAITAARLITVQP